MTGNYWGSCHSLPMQTANNYQNAFNNKRGHFHPHYRTSSIEDPMFMDVNGTEKQFNDHSLSALPMQAFSETYSHPIVETNDPQLQTNLDFAEGFPEMQQLFGTQASQQQQLAHVHDNEFPHSFENHQNLHLPHQHIHSHQQHPQQNLHQHAHQHQHQHQHQHAQLQHQQQPQRQHQSQRQHQHQQRQELQQEQQPHRGYEKPSFSNTPQKKLSVLEETKSRTQKRKLFSKERGFNTFSLNQKPSLSSDKVSDSIQRPLSTKRSRIFTESKTTQEAERRKPKTATQPVQLQQQQQLQKQQQWPLTEQTSLSLLYPAEAPFYELQANGEVFDLRFNSQEDMRRASCRTITELKHLASHGQPEKSPATMERLPPARYRQNEGPRYDLISAATACADFSVAESMLKSGAVQETISAFHDTEFVVNRMWLLTLLRLVVSCKDSTHLLIYSAEEIYGFLLNILQENDEHYYVPVKKRELSDSRAYDSFLILAFAAHSRPMLNRRESVSFRKQCMYEQHAQLIIRHYGEVAKCDPEKFMSSLPKYMAQCQSTLTMHDMALEIFVDIVDSGLFTYFAKNIMNARWAKVFTTVMKQRPLDSLKIHLCRVLHQAPRSVTQKIETPSEMYEKCFEYLAEALERIVDQGFVGMDRSNEPPLHLQFIISSAKALISMSRGKDLGSRFDGVVTFLTNDSAAHVLLRYVLTAPYCPLIMDDEDHQELYDTVWTLIHTISYTMPMMTETMVEYACGSSDTPLALAGHAAMFVGSLIAFTNLQTTRDQTYQILCTIRKYALEASTENTRNIRMELAYRLKVILENADCDVKTEVLPFHSPMSLSRLQGHKFRPESEIVNVGPRTVDAIKWFEDDEIVLVDPSHSGAGVDDDEILNMVSDNEGSDCKDEFD